MSRLLIWSVLFWCLTGFGLTNPAEAGWFKLTETKPTGQTTASPAQQVGQTKTPVRRGWFKSYHAAPEPASETTSDEGTETEPAQPADEEPADEPGDETTEAASSDEETGDETTDTDSEPIIPVASLGAWLPVVEPGGEIFPSLHLVLSLITMSRDDIELQTEDQQTSDNSPEVLGDQDGMIGIVVRSPADQYRVKVTVACPTLMSPGTVELVLPQKGLEYIVFPRIVWDFDKLLACRQTVPANLTFTVTGDGRKPEERVETVRVRTINDCPYFYIDGETSLDLNWMFTAYVNEDHPFIDRVLQEALQSGVVKRFNGYQDGDSKEVVRQVFALWHTLRAQGIKYSSITRTPSQSDSVLSQHVRFVDQAIENTQANCVDGSILFASLLSKIDLDPFLVVLPDHAFIGFHLNPDHTEQAFLETTMLSEVSSETADLFPELDEELTAKWRNSSSWREFRRAAADGAEQFEEQKTKLEGSDPMYQVIDLEEARRRGIMPIAYRKP
ncbi:MAG TPA: hypothetical protein PKO06_09110 [Candidatus Ozemobacteraceae bacterium]|nr:hypothetical protein [Candidatus Ozemobacteraceae bacterium]